MPDKQERDFHDWATLLILVLTLFAAGCAAMFTGWQAWIARDQAESARQQLMIARDTELSQLRAYIGVETITLRPVANGSQVIADVTVKNFGVTPANSVKVTTATTIFLNKFDPATTLSKSPTVTSFSLFPGSTKMIASLGERIDNWNVWQSTQSIRAVLVFGIVEYSTIFSNAERAQQQTTRFCVNAYQANAETLDSCLRYNQAD